MAQSFDFTDADNTYEFEVAVDTSVTADAVVAVGMVATTVPATFALTNPPAGFSVVDDDFGVIQWAGTEGSFPAGPTTLNITASEIGGSGTATATVTVTRATAAPLLQHVQPVYTIDYGDEDWFNLLENEGGSILTSGMVEGQVMVSGMWCDRQGDNGADVFFGQIAGPVRTTAGEGGLGYKVKLNGLNGRGRIHVNRDGDPVQIRDGEGELVDGYGQLWCAMQAERRAPGAGTVAEQQLNLFGVRVRALSVPERFTTHLGYDGSIWRPGTESFTWEVNLNDSRPAEHQYLRARLNCGVGGNRSYNGVVAVGRNKTNVLVLGRCNSVQVSTINRQSFDALRSNSGTVLNPPRGAFIREHATLVPEATEGISQERGATIRPKELDRNTLLLSVQDDTILEESGGEQTVTIVATRAYGRSDTSAPEIDVTLTAIAGVAYDEGTKRLTVPSAPGRANSGSQSFVLTPAADDLVEPDVFIRVAGTGLDLPSHANSKIWTIHPTMILFRDDDLPEISVTGPTSSLSLLSTAEFEFSVGSKTTTEDVKVFYSIGGIPINRVIGAGNGELTIPAGTTTGSISLKLGNSFLPFVDSTGRTLTVDIVGAEGGGGSRPPEISASASSTAVTFTRTTEAIVVASLEANADSVDETDGSVSFTVRISETPTSPVTVTWEVDAAATTTHADSYTVPTNRTLTFAANTTDLSQTFSIPLENDTIVEPVTTIATSIALSTPPAGVFMGEENTATVTVTDQDTATVSLARAAGASGSVSEGDTVMLEARLSAPVAVPTTVRWSLAGGITDEDVDELGTDIITFPASTAAGAKTQSFSLTITDDDVDEGLELLEATVAVEAVDDDVEDRITVADGLVVVPILTSDVRISFSAGTFRATEGAGEVTIPLVLSRGPDVATMVAITATASGATAADYELGTTTVAVDVFQTEAGVVLAALPDGAWDGSAEESVTLTIGTITPTGVLTVGEQNTAQVVLVDAEYDPAKTIVQLVASRTSVDEGGKADQRLVRISAMVSGANLSQNNSFRLEPLTSAVEHTAVDSSQGRVDNFDILRDMTLVRADSGEHDIAASTDGEVRIKNNQVPDFMYRSDGELVFDATIVLTAVPFRDAESIVVLPVHIRIEDDDQIKIGLERRPTSGNYFVDGVDKIGEEGNTGGLQEGRHRNYQLLFEPAPPRGFPLGEVKIGVSDGATLDDFEIWGSALVLRERESNALIFDTTLADGSNSIPFTVRARSDSVWEPDGSGRVTVRWTVGSNATGGSTRYTRDHGVYGIEIEDRDSAPALRVQLEPTTIRETVLDEARDGKVAVSVLLEGATIAKRARLIFAEPSNDYELSSLQVNVEAEESESEAVTLTVVDDNRVEGTEMIDIALNKDARAFSSFLDGEEITVIPATLTILDDDSTTPTVFAYPTASQFDENGSAVVSIKLSSTVTSAVTVELTVDSETTADAAVTELQDTEYTLPSPASVTFAAGATGDALAQEFTITLNDDDLVEASEDLVFDLALAAGAPSNVILNADSVNFEVTSTDTAAVAVTASGTVNEDGGSGVAEFTVTLTGQNAEPVTVEWTAGGAGGNTDDVSAITGTLTFPAATSSTPQSQVVSIDVVDDTITEGEEALTVEIANVSGNLSELVTISEEAGAATVNIAASDTIEVSMAATAVDATEGGSVVELLLTLGATYTEAFVVPLVVEYLNDATQAADWRAADTLNVTIPAGYTVGRFRMAAVDDRVWEGDFTEQMTVSLGDDLPPGLVAGANTMTTVTLIDNDPAPPFEVSLHAVDDHVTESGTSPTATFELRLTRLNSSTADLAVNWAIDTTNSTVAAADYNVTPTPVTFAAGANNVSELSKRFSVPLVNDDIVELEETLVVQISISDDGSAHGFAVGSESSASVVVRDADRAELSISTAATSIVEGEQVAFTIAMSNEVVVAVPLVWSIGGDVVDGDVDGPTTGTVTFAANADAAGRSQTLTLTATDDTESEGSENLVVSIAIGDTLDAAFADASSPRIRLSGSQSTASVTIAANDTEISFGAETLTAAETQEAVTVEINLSRAPGVEVTVPIVPTYGGATAADFTISDAGPLIIAANETRASFTVLAVADDTWDGADTESVSFAFGTFAPAGVLQTGTTATTTVEVIDAEFDPSAAPIIVRVAPTESVIRENKKPPNVGSSYFFDINVEIDVPPGGLKVPRTFTLVKVHSDERTTEKGAENAVDPRISLFFGISRAEIEVDADGNVTSPARMRTYNNSYVALYGYRSQKLVITMETDVAGIAFEPAVLTLEDEDFYDTRFNPGQDVLTEGTEGDFRITFDTGGTLDHPQGGTSFEFGLELGGRLNADRLGITADDLTITGISGTTMTVNADDPLVYDTSIGLNLPDIRFRIAVADDNLWERGVGSRPPNADRSAPKHEYVKIYLKNGGSRDGFPNFRSAEFENRQLDLYILDTTPAPAVAVAVSKSSVSEADSDRTVELTITVDGGTNNIQIEGDRRVTFTIEGTDVTSDDYTLSSTRGNFVSRSAASEPVTLTITDDVVDEEQETFTISAQLSEVGSSRLIGTDLLTIAPANVTVVDDDEGLGVTLNVSPGTISEGRGTVDVGVTATVAGGHTAPGNLRITLSLGNDGTAEQGATTQQGDFTVVRSIPAISIPQGQSVGRATFRIRVPDDSQAEPAETIRIVGRPNLGEVQVSAATITIEASSAGVPSSTRRLAVAQLRTATAGDVVGWRSDRSLGGASLTETSITVNGSRYRIAEITHNTRSKEFRFGFSSTPPVDVRNLRLHYNPTLVFSAATPDASGRIFTWRGVNEGLSETDYVAVTLSHVDVPLAFEREVAAEQVWMLGEAITPIQLPVARGNLPVLYRHAITSPMSTPDLPLGITYDADGSGACGQTTTLCGTPTELSEGQYTFTWTAWDGDGDYRTIKLSMVVRDGRSADFNGSGAVDEKDGLVLYYAMALGAVLGDGSDALGGNPGFEKFRIRILNRLLAPSSEWNDTNRKSLLRAVRRAVSHAGGSSLDINRDGTVTEADGLVIFYALALESILGDGSVGDTEPLLAAQAASFRRTFLGSAWTVSTDPTDDDFQAMLRRVHMLEP